MCGVVGVYGHPESSNLTYLGLHALQHRGQESAGIVSSHEGTLFVHRAMGHVEEVFDEAALAKVPGRVAIGHVRYSTTGGSHLRNAQPIAVNYSKGSLAVCHNGNLTNAEELRDTLEEKGSIFQSDSDSEVLVHLVAGSRQIAMEDRISDSLSQVKGAYSLLFLTEREMIAVRDPLGIRPLCLGILPGASFPNVVASEPVAFDLLGAKYVRDVEPGEMIVVDDSGIRSSRIGERAPRAMCVFEYVYFARPDSALSGRSVYEVRKALGAKLAIEAPADVDVVIPVPDSGVPAALGFAREKNLPFEMGLIRSHYVGRTFIEPQQQIRHFGVRLKLNPVERVLAGKRVLVVDDSIVRGTTSRKIVKMIRDAGAKEVHMRISSPPTEWPCYYGIDTPTRRELIASSHSKEEIARYITADTLAYLSLEGMLEAVAGSSDHTGYCHACFSGKYPVPFTPSQKHRLRLVGG